jgi:predicted amidohydrolase YtcJ
MTADLIVAVDRLHTMAGGSGGQTAIAMAGGVITAVGDRADIRDWRGPGTEVIDLGRATVTPGPVDGYTHPVTGISLTRGLDLSAARTPADLTEALRGARRDGWVRGWGLDPNLFGNAPITHAPITAALGPDVPVLLLLFDAHSALVSPRALEMADIDGPWKFTSGASVACDADGRPTGHLLEWEAIHLVRGLLPADTPAARRARLLDVLRRMAAAGLTAGLGDRAGRLLPGFRADLTAFALDPLTAGAEEFAESPVELTVVAGTISHRGPHA